MVAVPTTGDERISADDESHVLLHGVSWELYVALRDAADDSGSNVRMTYLTGSLELVSPSSLHGEATKILARLLEIWSFEKRVDLRGFGNTTFRNRARERGLEPDECYTLGPLVDDGVPHIAIEAIVKSPLLDKLEVYAGLGVPEVWIWRAKTGAIGVHCLVDNAYVVTERSRILPALEVALLARFVRPGESHLALVEAYLAALRG